MKSVSSSNQPRPVQCADLQFCIIMNFQVLLVWADRELGVPRLWSRRLLRATGQGNFERLLWYAVNQPR